jgi:hypothetical protein
MGLDEFLAGHRKLLLGNLRQRRGRGRSQNLPVEGKGVLDSSETHHGSRDGNQEDRDLLVGDDEERGEGVGPALDLLHHLEAKSPPASLACWEMR